MRELIYADLRQYLHPRERGLTCDARHRVSVNLMETGYPDKSNDIHIKILEERFSDGSGPQLHAVIDKYELWEVLKVIGEAKNHTPIGVLPRYTARWHDARG